MPTFGSVIVIFCASRQGMNSIEPVWPTRFAIASTTS